MGLAQEQDIPAPMAPYSPAIQAGDILYISGQVPLNPETGTLVPGDIREQTRQVMTNLGSVLNRHGYTYGDLVKCTVFMTDMDNYEAINEVYGSFFNDRFPAREAVQVVRLPEGAMVEISGIAVKPKVARP
ncbi:MAG: RidA family protein [Bacteroidales bacterium]|nr:RidA family protein [Bacteroidales bacterium]